MRLVAEGSWLKADLWRSRVDAVRSRLAMASQSLNPLLAGARRILIIRPSALGDVCRSVPVLASLRAALPAARIDWLVQDSFVDGVLAHPMLDGVLPLPRSRLRRWATPAGALDSLRWLSTLARGRYDIVVDAQGLLRSACFGLATRAPVRVGYSNAPEGAWLLYTHASRVALERHSVDRMCALLAPLGVPPVLDTRLYAPRGAWERVRQTLGLEHAERYVVLAPTSRWPGKRWRIERFGEVASALLNSGSVARVVVVGAGGGGERSQCAPIFDASSRDARVIDGVGRTSVGELMALIEHSALVIANDSAALHMGVGFDRPIVALYGPTDTARVGPWQRESSVIQHVTPSDRLDHKDEPLGRALMDRISVQEVIDRALTSLQPANSANAAAGLPVMAP